MTSKRICLIKGCDKPHFGHGFCKMHYQRWRRNGGPRKGYTFHGEPQEYLFKVVVPYDGDECLIWPFARNTAYSPIKLGKIITSVHRYMCEIANGPSPTPFHVAAHNCGNRKCVNKRHLRWATVGENMRDKIIHGTIRRGESLHTSKLTEAKVRFIREMRGSVSAETLGEKFSVYPSTIRAVWRRKTWKHI